MNENIKVEEEEPKKRPISPKTRSRMKMSLPGRLTRVERHSSLGIENLHPTPIRIRCVGNYDLGRTIGKGQFGKVKLATHVLTGETVAVKIINKKKLTQKALDLVQREIHILKRLSHPHIIQLYEVLETERVLFLIMEHASGGEALDFVVTHGKMSEDRARVFFQQIVSAIDYCHANEVSHRDLKAENLLLDRDLNIKIIDFGLANMISSKKFSTPCGSPNYAAPEIIRKDEYDGPAVDVWCMGIVLFVFLCGKLPFKGTDIQSLFRQILNGVYEIPHNLSEECRDLIKSMLCVDVEERISVKEILEHPWICKNWTYIDSQPTPQKTIVIEPPIAIQLEQLGFNIDNVQESLQNNKFNQGTATYYLLSRKRKSEIPSDMMTRTRSAATLGKYVGGVVSMPNSTAPSPVGSLHPSPATSRGPSPTHSPLGNFVVGSPSPPKDVSAFSLIQKRRIAQSHCQRRGHKRTRSDKVDVMVESPVRPEQPAEMEPVKRAKSVTVKPNTPTRDEEPLPVPIPNIEEEQKEEKVENQSVEQPKQDNWVIMAPQRAIGHRRYKSEDKINQIMGADKIRKNSPATRPLWRTSHKETKNEGEEPGVRRLTEQEVQTWKATEESERRQISTSSEQLSPPTSPKNFASYVNWAKRMLSRRPVEQQNQPREVRTSFSSSTTSRKSPKEILSEIRRVFNIIGIQYESTSPYFLKAHFPQKDLQFEIEICIPPNLTDIYVIRLRRVSGDWLLYKEKCQAVSENLRL